MSEFRMVWICMLTSGDMKSLSPLTGEANLTPSSLILRIAPRLQTWKPPAVGQDGLVPLPSNWCRPPKLCIDVEPRAHPEVEGVAEDDLRAHVVQAARHHALDGAVGADRHEDRRLHHAMVELQGAAAGVAVGVGLEQIKLEHR